MFAVQESVTRPSPPVAVKPDGTAGGVRSTGRAETVPDAREALAWVSTARSS